jgi:hypothetical protein
VRRGIRSVFASPIPRSRSKASKTARFFPESSNITLVELLIALAPYAEGVR